MSIVLQSSGGGSVTLQEPSTASNVTVTIPASTGTAMVSGNMPAFSAYSANTQSVSNNVWTKIQVNTEDFDTNSCYDTTNYRFTPNVAGYYLLMGAVYPSSATSQSSISFYKNGSLTKVFYFPLSDTTGTASTLFYLNGSTDYVELYCFMTGTTPLLANYGVYFQGSMVRSA